MVQLYDVLVCRKDSGCDEWVNVPPSLQQEPKLYCQFDFISRSQDISRQLGFFLFLRKECSELRSQYNSCTLHISFFKI